MKELEERIKEYLQIGDEVEVITLIEDELEDIINHIFQSGAVSPTHRMGGNATILKSMSKGFIVKMDDGDVVYLSKSSCKGFTPRRGNRLQCGIIKSLKDGKRVCFDAMDCFTYEDLRYQMFLHIEERDMAMAATFAWAIYNEANEEDRANMKLCIHALRNYMKRINKEWRMAV